MFYKQVNLNKRGEMIAVFEKAFSVRYDELVEPVHQLCQQHQTVQNRQTT